MQSNFVVLAENCSSSARGNTSRELIRDDVAEKAFYGKKLSKTSLDKEIIKDEISPTAFEQGFLTKIEPVKSVIAEKIPSNVSSRSVYKPKFIDENAENVYVFVSSVESLASKKGLYEGKQVVFRVAANVNKNNELFIKKDAPVSAYVETITKSSFAGDPEELVLGRYSTQDINGNKVDLSGQISKKGANRALWVKPLMYAGYVVPIFGSPLLLLYFVRGGSAKIKTNQQFQLYFE